ncbi:hypothetical protein L208DRAFT_1401950 [Tricholoma matsutake]|nr:hypothetical protein L208DRAFT_1401950 [Tricholoma matsutake 945]
MSFLKISLLFSLVVCLIISAASVSIQETNAQRMARGLNPLPPKFGRTLPGVVTARVTARAPTRSWAAKRGWPSAVPPMQRSGRIEVRNPQNGLSLGIVKNTNGTNPISGLNALGPEQDLLVSFTASPSGAGPFDIVAVNAAFAAPLFVGAFVANGVGNIGRDVITFSNVQQTPPNSPPVKSASGDNTMAESALWSFNPSTKELQAQYVNPDGSKPDTVIAYSIRQNVLFFIGDLKAYNTNNDTPASAVKFYLVPV